jgi:hypothetical protein
MEVTALKGSSGDVQHFADRIIAERGVRYGRVAMIPKRRPNAHLASETPVVACPFRVQRPTSPGLERVSALPSIVLKKSFFADD